MKFTNPNDDEIYVKLKSEINNVKGAFILLKRLFSVIECISCDMPGFLQSLEGQAAFYKAIMKLTREQLILPVGKKPNTPNGLHLKYRINRNYAKTDKELTSQIIRNIALPATIDYYIKNPDDFISDKDVINTISNFIRQTKSNHTDRDQINVDEIKQDLVTVNERAYMLFGDEKFFKGDDKNRSRGEIVLKRLGLDYSSIRCVETIEPFFSFVRKDFHSNTSRNIFIIENKDTFWSFKRNIMDCSSTLKSDMLIYGEGKKIISSFMFVDEYDIDSEKDTFFYFGDLDVEGVNIFCELCDKYPLYRIMPFHEGYQSALAIGLQRELQKTPKQQVVNEANIDRFVKMFDQAYAEKLGNLLKGGYYIPQEALSAAHINERFGSK